MHWLIFLLAIVEDRDWDAIGVGKVCEMGNAGQVLLNLAMNGGVFLDELGD